jgi:hypothetical protein
VLVLDLLGGPAAERDDCVERCNAVTGAVFVWEQERFEPVSREIVCYLSLRDGAKVKPTWNPRSLLQTVFDAACG